MFIQTEETPNPSTLKFLPGQEVLPNGSMDFRSEHDAKKSPLAAALFNVDGVVGVFFSDDFITITKRDDKDWHVSQIKELLYTRVRPAVAQDGGDIVFEDFTDGTVTVQMRGACAGCPSSTATLKMGIENMLRHYIPEVKEVVAAEM